MWIERHSGHARQGKRKLKTIMIAVRIPKSQWGRAWRAMVELAPVRLVSDEPIYEVLPAHLELLNAEGFTFEAVKPRALGGVTEHPEVSTW